MKTNRRWFLQALSTGAVITLTGCSADQLIVSTPTEMPPPTRERTPTRSAGGPRSGEGLSIVLSEMPRGLDPIIVDHRPSRVVIRHIFEGLYAYERTTEPVPRLARSAPEVSNNAQRWTIELHPDGTFQDGAPVRADDVVYSYQAPVVERTAVESSVEMIDSVEAIDERTVEFDLDAPDSSFLHRLTHPIVPEMAREADRGAFNRESTTGSGPFELTSWENGMVQLHRSERYWGDWSPELAAVSFTSIGTPEGRATGLQEGSVDVVEIPDVPSWTAVHGLQSGRIVSAPRSIYYYVAFNCREGPTRDRRVREAVDLVFDMDEAVETHVGSIGGRQYSPLPRPVAQAWEMPLSRWEALPHGRNIERARDLFDGADVPSDYPWRLIVPPDDTREGIARDIAAGLEEAGFTNPAVDRLEWGAFYGRYTSGNEADYNLYLLGWQHVPDPDAFTYHLFGRTPEVLGITNGTFYGDHSERGAEAAGKFLQARRTVDRSVRRQLYREGITTVLEDRAHLPAYHTRHAFGVSDAVEDLTVVPTDGGVRLHGPETNTKLATVTDTND